MVYSYNTDVRSFTALVNRLRLRPKSFVDINTSCRPKLQTQLGMQVGDHFSLFISYVPFRVQHFEELDIYDLLATEFHSS